MLTAQDLGHIAKHLNIAVHVEPVHAIYAIPSLPSSFSAPSPQPKILSHESMPKGVTVINEGM